MLRRCFTHLGKLSGVDDTTMFYRSRTNLKEAVLERSVPYGPSARCDMLYRSCGPTTAESTPSLHGSCSTSLASFRPEAPIEIHPFSCVVSVCVVVVVVVVVTPGCRQLHRCFCKGVSIEAGVNAGPRP